MTRQPPHRTPALPCRTSLARLGVVRGCLWVGFSGALFGAMFGGSAAQAQAVATPQPAATATSAPEAALDILPSAEQVKDALESTRRNTRSVSEWLARSVDSWFGDKPFEEGGKVSEGRLTLGLYKRSDQTQDIDLRFNARFKLPNVERYAYLFIGRDDPRNVIKDTPDAFSRRQQLVASRPEDRSFLAGLGVTLPQNIDFRVGISARLKPYVQARYAKPWTLTPTQQIELRETVFWTESDQVGSTTALTWGFKVSPQLSVRWLNAATITQASRNFEWSSGLGAYRGFGNQRLLSLELLATGNGNHGTGVGMSDYGVLAKWEYPVYKNWLLCELVAGHFWPRADAHSERGQAWALGGSFKLLF